MGRYVRVVLRALAERTGIALTLLVRRPADAAAYRAIVGQQIDVAPLAAARGRAFDRIWYPWNGMRFPARAPALVTINDDFAFRFPARGPVARWREQQPIRRAVRRARALVTISAWSRAVLAERFAIPADRIGIIPLAPDPYFVPGPSAGSSDRPFVLAVGAGEPRKNIGFLITALERAFPNHEVGLTIVGRPDRSVAARLATSSLAVTVRADNVDDAELRELYRSATVVAVPSLAEGFGLVAVEAQACGAAVLAAAAGALPEAVGAAGITLPPTDVEGWARALRMLVDEPHVNARYRQLAAARWAAGPGERTLSAVLQALELIVDDRS